MDRDPRRSHVMKLLDLLGPGQTQTGGSIAAPAIDPRVIVDA
jgi:hypothetical protein